MIVKGYECDDCGHLFTEPAGPKYTCNSCGHEQLEERRCEECNRFMAKDADEVCPECEADTITECELWMGADGSLYVDEQAEQVWLADAPLRAAQKAESDLRTEAMMQEMQRNALARSQALAPKVASLLTAVRLRASAVTQLEQTLAWALKMLQDDPATGGVAQVPFRFDEIGILLAPQLEHNVRTAMALRLDTDARRPYVERVRAALLERIKHPGILARMAGEWDFSPGATPLLDIDTVVEGLLPLLEEGGKE